MIQASYKGISFHIQNADNEFGNRIAIHQSPGKDVPDNERLGRAGRVFQVQGFLLGSDHLLQAQDLREAVEEGTTGTLIHPYYGTLQVDVTRLRTSNKATSKNITDFTIHFIEAGEQDVITELPSEPNIEQIQPTTFDRIREGFETVYDVTSVPYELARDAQTAIDQGLSLITETRRIVGSVADFQRTLENINSRGDQLAFDVSNLANELQDVLTFGATLGTSGVSTNSADQVAEFRAMAESITITGDESPADALNQFILQNICIAWGGLLTTFDFKTRDEAKEVFYDLINRYDELIAVSMNYDISSALDDFRAELTKYADEKIFNLPSITKLTLNVNTPALVLSHQLYGNIENEQEILDRNKINHPGFIQPAVELEVVNHAD